jgi:hypothetical protein
MDTNEKLDWLMGESIKHNTLLVSMKEGQDRVVGLFEGIEPRVSFLEKSQERALGSVWGVSTAVGAVFAVVSLITAVAVK